MAQQKQQAAQMNKSPSQTSTTSNQSSSSNATQPNANLFNMFGTSLPSNPPPQNIAQQPNMVKQPVIPVTTAAKQADNNNGFDFWANPTKSNPTQPQPQPAQTAKTVTPIQPVPVSPVINKTVQQAPNPIQTVTPAQSAQQNPQQGQNKTPTDKPPRTTTFNALFGLGPK